LSELQLGFENWSPSFGFYVQNSLYFRMVTLCHEVKSDCTVKDSFRFLHSLIFTPTFLLRAS